MSAFNEEAFLKKLMLHGARQTPAQKRTTGQANYALLRTDDPELDGTEVVIKASEIAEVIGSFHGKTGSKRRNRKGRTWTMPNGSRRYLNGSPLESCSVIAYQAKPGVSKWVARYSYLP